MIGIPKKSLCFALMATLFMVWGCDTSGKKPKNKLQKTPRFAFVDSSSGLPSSGQWRQGLAFHDMNGDGHLDILATPRRTPPEGEKRPLVWYGNGRGEWSRSFLDVPANMAYDYGSIAVADFDRDGITDIGLAMHNLGFTALKGQKDGKFGDFSSGIPPYSEFASRALVTADLNNDGISDIVALSEYVSEGVRVSRGVMWCFFEGGSWKCRPIGENNEDIGCIGDQLVVGDVNNDGNKDIAITAFNHRRDLIVWLGDGRGGFRPFNTGLPLEKHYNSVALADVNKDGRDDLIVSISSFKDEFKGVKVFISGPDGFTDMSDGLPADEESWGYFATAGDLDGDGTVEVVTAPKKGGLMVFSLNGNRWEEVRTSGLPEKGLFRIFNMYCFDINKDGQKDIVVIYGDSNDDSGGIRVFLNASQKK